MFRSNDGLNMTIAVDWDVKPQTKPKVFWQAHGIVKVVVFH